MTYPQPDSNAYASSGYDFFRLNTQLVSGGDIYESEQGSQAFVLGPESDVSRVKVTYFDQESPNFVNNIVLGPDRQFVGRVDANTRSTYSPSGRDGRILIAPDNLYNPDFGPLSPVANSTILIVPPVLDVIQYFQDPGSLVAGRNDKIYRFQSLAWGSNNHSPIYIAVPFYGRKFVSFNFQLPLTTTDTMKSLLWGIDFDYVSDTPNQVTLLPTSAAAHVGQTGVYNVAQAPGANFSTGMYDYIMFFLTLAVGTDPQPGVFAEITVSDSEF